MLLKVDVELSLPFRALLDDDDDISFFCLWQPVQDFTDVFYPASVYLCFWC